MTIHHAQKFLAKMRQDRNLSIQLEQASTDVWECYRNKNDQATFGSVQTLIASGVLNAVVRVAAEMGYPMEGKELIAAVRGRLRRRLEQKEISCRDYIVARQMVSEGDLLIDALLAYC